MNTIEQFTPEPKSRLREIIDRSKRRSSLEFRSNLKIAAIAMQILLREAVAGRADK